MPRRWRRHETGNKPILLSIGYAACHWCHVMAHELFEDPDTAALMNERFVNIKVDREERPDIDHLYMSALHALGEQGGWPLTMFIAPDGAPFWGGTYFPPEPRWGRPSFRQVLQGVSEAYRTDDEMVAKNTAALRQVLARMSRAEPGDLPTPVHLDAVAAALLRLNDPEHGGLQGAPKFPNPPIFRFLWQNAFRTGAPEGQEALHLMLHRMSQGGIYDHLGGGYSRYSTDAIWLVPHFEKMLYDNAQLLELLALAHAHRPDPLYAERAGGDRRLDGARHDGGARGRPRRVRRVRGCRQRGRGRPLLRLDRGRGGRAARRRRGGIQARLRRDGRRQLGRPYDPAPGHADAGSAEDETALARSRAVLFEARAQRVRPGRDDKVLADWNGLAIAALARAAVRVRAARMAGARGGGAGLHPGGDVGDRMVACSTPGGSGRVTAAGLLDDQAAMARASLALFEATGEQRRLAAGDPAGGRGGGGVLRRAGRVLHSRRRMRPTCR